MGVWSEGASPVGRVTRGSVPRWGEGAPPLGVGRGSYPSSAGARVCPRVCEGVWGEQFIGANYLGDEWAKETTFTDNFMDQGCG